MSSLTVGGTVIPVAHSSPNGNLIESADRASSFDNTYRVSVTGGIRREWTFETPTVLKATSDTYRAQLAIPSAQVCAGDILVSPIMCCAELTGFTPVAAQGIAYERLQFVLHEVQPATVLFRYTPGDTVAGETFTGAANRAYRDVNGLVAFAGVNVKRDAHYDISDLTPLSKSLFLEGPATNVALWNRDLTNAAWTKTNITAVKNQTGADGVATSATALTATAGNGTCTQAVTLASSSRAMSAYVFRGAGTGPIQMTTDGGGTWTAITPGPTSSYARVYIPAQTLANPNFGFRIVTNGDSIAVDYVQNETGIVTSPIPTTTAAVARGTDLLSWPFTEAPREMTIYMKLIERGTIATAGGTLALIGNTTSSSPAFAGSAPAGFYTSTHLNSTAVMSAMPAAPVYNDTVEICFRLSGDGSVNTSQSINGGATTHSVPSAALALAAAWSGALFWPNGASASVHGFEAIKSIKMVAGSRTLAVMRTL